VGDGLRCDVRLVILSVLIVTSRQQRNLAAETAVSNNAGTMRRGIDKVTACRPVARPRVSRSCGRSRHIMHDTKSSPALSFIKIYNGYSFSRPTLEDLRRGLRAVTKKCWLDWDISPNSKRLAARPEGTLLPLRQNDPKSW
jgi:hypothetical protein